MILLSIRHVAYTLHHSFYCYLHCLCLQTFDTSKANQTYYRIYSRSAVKHITQNCGRIGDGFIILSEILVELYFNNFKIGETKSTFVNRIRGESSVNFNEIYKSLIGLFKIYKLKKKITKKIL